MTKTSDHQRKNIFYIAICKRNTLTYPEYFGVKLIGETEKKESRVFTEMCLQSVLTMSPETLNLQWGAFSYMLTMSPEILNLQRGAVSYIYSGEQSVTCSLES